MIIRLNSLISILLTTMLVFNYAIGNIVYATESADGANQSSTQNPRTDNTEEEEQSTENSQEHENSVVLNHNKSRSIRRNALIVHPSIKVQEQCVTLQQVNLRSRQNLW